MPLFSILDLVALARLRRRLGRLRLSGRAHAAWPPAASIALMDGYRETWMRRMLAREQRMVDMQIMAALQNGTAFFASTSLIAIGGALTLLRSTDEMIAIASQLPLRHRDHARAVGGQDDRAHGDLRLCLLQVRLGLPALQLRGDPARRDAVCRPTRIRPRRKRMCCARQGCSRPPAGISIAASAPSSSRSAISAGSPDRWYFMATTAVVVVVMWWRQFASDSLRAVAGD